MAKPAYARDDMTVREAVQRVDCVEYSRYLMLFDTENTDAYIRCDLTCATVVGSDAA